MSLYKCVTVDRTLQYKIWTCKCKACTSYSKNIPWISSFVFTVAIINTLQSYPQDRFVCEYELNLYRGNKAYHMMIMHAMIM